MRTLARSISLAAAAVLFAACAEQPYAPQQSADPLTPLASASGLTVGISSPQGSWVSYPQTAEFYGSVSGGSGTYHYTWRMSSCNEYPLGYEWCESQYVRASGVGVDYTTRYRDNYDTQLNVWLDVYDVNDPSKTGSAYYWMGGPHTISCNPNHFC